MNLFWIRVVLQEKCLLVWHLVNTTLDIEDLPLLFGPLKFLSIVQNRDKVTPTRPINIRVSHPETCQSSLADLWSAATVGFAPVGFPPVLAANSS